jgi:hypothetical protein
VNYKSHWAWTELVQLTLLLLEHIFFSHNLFFWLLLLGFEFRSLHFLARGSTTGVMSEAPHLFCFYFYLFETGSHSVAQIGIELIILLPLTSVGSNLLFFFFLNGYIQSCNLLFSKDIWVYFLYVTINKGDRMRDKIVRFSWNLYSCSLERDKNQTTAKDPISNFKW